MIDSKGRLDVLTISAPEYGRSFGGDRYAMGPKVPAPEYGQFASTRCALVVIGRVVPPIQRRAIA